MFEFERSEENPVLLPHARNTWESNAAFNGCPAIGNGKIHFLYRAVSAARTSSIGYAQSRDGVHFGNRRQFIWPEYEWEKFGCEDPRVTKLGGKYYVFYTALSAFPFTPEGIRIGAAVTRDFKKIEKHPVTPFNAKAMALFPKKIRGKMAAILTVNTDRPPARACIAFFDNEKQIWSEKYWKKWYENLEAHEIGLGRNSNDHIEVGAPPIKTKHGWLLIYSYIENYFAPPANFSVEAVLLDIKDPTKIVARTKRPILISQEEYEKYGEVPNIVFPTGLLLKNGLLYLYYGAADTVCALAVGRLKDLLRHMLKPEESQLKRYSLNPILAPSPEHAWEKKAAFNAGVLRTGGKTHLLYRAMSADNTSVLGYAASVDGYKIDERLPEPIYVPREGFENKMVSGGNSGCEDPRLMKIGSRIYMLYTAYNGKDVPRVAMTSISSKDFLAHRWDWRKPVLVSPPGMDDKDAAFFPKKIKGKYAILHRLGVNIWIDFVDSLNFKGDKFIKGKVLMTPRVGMRDSQKIGIAGPPIQTKLGWLLIYHGISKKPDHHYHLRAALLDLKDPTKVLVRTKDPILEPELPYERNGLVPNVVFSNGHALIKDTLYVYYGGADKVTGVATIKLQALLNELKKELRHAKGG
ncbi:MAG: hypothetical protein V1856_02965 [Candidatus Liptonbacteria bacterium]